VVVLFWLVGWAAGSETGFSDAAWQASAAFASLGWTREPEAALAAWPVAIVALVGALGWATWIVVVPSWRRRYVAVRGLCWVVCGYVVFLLVAAALVCALEGPRAGPRGVERQSEHLADQPLSERSARGLTQIVCASGAGLPTEALSDRGVSDGTKMTLAAVVLVGGMAGAAGGGVKWPLVLAAVGGVALALRHRRRKDAQLTTSRYALAGGACLLLMLTLATIVALGLLLIENHTASPYQPSPTFADAFLDASSAVGGANLSSGLTARVTSRNLLTGMRQAANLYQYGMAWLMLAMLAGRVLPLLVVCRIADAASAAAHPSPPVLL
jgi:Trk-type K+ transport system membrane component